MDERLSVFFPHRPVKGSVVVYWMDASLRFGANLALDFAAAQARGLNLPLEVVVFDHHDDRPRHRAFRLEGLVEIVRTLGDRGFSVHILSPTGSDPAQVLGRVLGAGSRVKAALAVSDFRAMEDDKLRIRRWAEALDCPLAVVEDLTSRPLKTAAEKAQWNAATFRPKLMRQVTAEVEAGLPTPLRFHDKPQPPLGLAGFSDFLAGQGLPPLSVSLLERELESLPRFPHQRGGEKAALVRLENFLDHKLEHYDRLRGDPTQDGVSGLSPAFRHGFLSPLTLVAQLADRGLWKAPLSYRSCGLDPVSKFIDEALVRRELSFNHVFYTDGAGTWESLPPWSRKTLENHRSDTRAFTYGLGDWENAQTHDRAWNAAQNQLKTTGVIHGTMRMYWGKKILEWSSSPELAYRTALDLNNRWALDGDDPNSVAGVGWCLGLHDRPWGERPVYGLVRSMTEGGLRKKFDLEAYIKLHSSPGVTPRP